jgi:hypothetical protein
MSAGAKPHLEGGEANFMAKRRHGFLKRLSIFNSIALDAYTYQVATSYQYPWCNRCIYGHGHTSKIKMLPQAVYL